MKSLDGVIGSHSYVLKRVAVNASIPLDFNDVEILAALFGIPPLEFVERARANMVQPPAQKTTPQTGYTGADEASLRRLGRKADRK